ncbi:MAG: Mo-dependent nitrogenase C-terminal domain-containing protein [Thermostichus sp. HHBFW_bins_43]
MTYPTVNSPAAANTVWHPFKRLLDWLRRWLNSIEIKSLRQARWICRLIPASCPFERDIRLGSRTLHIPALCRINPLYEPIIALRLRAAHYLANASTPVPTPSETQPCP